MTAVSSSHLGSVPVLETERLVLRGPAIGDFDAVAAFYADPRSQPVGGCLNRVEAWTRFTSGAGQWLLRGYGFWEIEDRATGRNVGRAGIYHPDGWPEPELGWMIYAGTDEGRGLAREAATAAREGAALHFGMSRVMSSIEASNHRSIQLAERMGAVRDGMWNTPYGPMLRFRHGVAP